MGANVTMRHQTIHTLKTIDQSNPPTEGHLLCSAQPFSEARGTILSASVVFAKFSPRSKQSALLSSSVWGCSIWPFTSAQRGVPLYHRSTFLKGLSFYLGRGVPELEAWLRGHEDCPLVPLGRAFFSRSVTPHHGGGVRPGTPPPLPACSAGPPGPFGFSRRAGKFFLAPFFGLFF